MNTRTCAVFVVIIFSMITVLSAGTKKNITIKKIIYLQKHIDILNMQDYALSPDGNYLAAVRKKPQILTVYNTNDFSEKNYPLPKQCTGKVRVHYLAWSPDSRRLAFTEQLFRYWFEPDIWVFDTTDGTFQNLTDDGKSGGILSVQCQQPCNFDYCPVWDRESKGVYFIRTTREKGKGMSAESVWHCVPGGAPRLIYAFDKKFRPFTVFRKPVLSPDGTRLALLSQGSQYDDPLNGVWIVDIKGKKMVQTVTYKKLLTKVSPEISKESYFNMKDACWINNGTSLLVVFDNTGNIGRSPVINMQCIVHLKQGTIVSLTNTDLNSSLHKPEHKKEHRTGISCTVPVGKQSLLFVTRDSSKGDAGVELVLAAQPAALLKGAPPVPIGSLKDILLYMDGYTPVTSEISANGMVLIKIFNCIVQLDGKIR